jgi:hypothetical protein
MKKVGDILDNIRELDEQYKIINNITNKMTTDEEAAIFMFKKFGVDQKSLQSIANTLLCRRYDLEGQLRETEVDIN